MIDIRNVGIKGMAICPSPLGLYVGSDGNPDTAFADIIENRELKQMPGKFSFVVPGLMEWYNRYLKHLSDQTQQFDWVSWHREGLHFTEYIYNCLPRSVSLQYIVPVEDTSGCLESFEVSAEKIDFLLSVLGDCQSDRDDVDSDEISVGIKEEDGNMLVRLMIKDTSDKFMFLLNYNKLGELKDFLEKIAFCTSEPVIWDSRYSYYGMHFYPQTIGGLKNMGQFHIYEKNLFTFSAYVNSRDLIRSLYRSIMTYTASLDDKGPYKTLHSGILDCYIDDSRCHQLSFFKNYPRLADLIAAPISHLRNFFNEICETIQYDSDSQ